MASIALRLSSPLNPNPNPSRLPYRSPPFLSNSGLPAHRRPLPSLCRCRGARSDGGGGDGGEKRWDEVIQDMVSRAVKRWDDYVKTYRSSQLIDSKDLGSEKAVESKEEEEGEAEGDWDWERWKRHFAEMEEQERIVAVLKMQLRESVAREDYADAVKLKLAISGAEKNDAVGTALSDLHRAVEEERYKDAAFLRDHGGVGLVYVEHNASLMF